LKFKLYKSVFITEIRSVRNVTLKLFQILDSRQISSIVTNQEIFHHQYFTHVYCRGRNLFHAKLTFSYLTRVHKSFKLICKRQIYYIHVCMITLV